MWLYLPTCISASSVAPGDSTSLSESQCRDLAASLTLNGKSVQPAFLQRAWKTGALKPLQFGPASNPFLANSLVAAWLESLGDSLARTCPSPAEGQGSTESTQDSGSNTSESFAQFGPNGSLLKTSPQLSLFPREEPYLEGLPKAGSMRNGSLCERPTLALPIEENEYSSWPSARAEDESCGNHPNASDSLGGAARTWVTPKCQDLKHATMSPAEAARHEPVLAGQVSTWPTPNANPAAPNSNTTRENGREAARITDQCLERRAAQWGTPNAHERTFEPREVDHGTQLANQTAIWNTPTSEDGKAGHDGPKSMAKDSGGAALSSDLRLRNQIEDWPTPDASPERGANRRYIYGDERTGRMLKQEAQKWTTPQSHDVHPGKEERVGRFGTEAGGQT